MKRPDLLLLVAIWEFLTAAFALIGIAAIAILAFPAINTYVYDIYSRNAAFFGLSIAIFILGVYVVVAILGGTGLLAGKEWGRITSIIQAAISLLMFPFGTAIGILMLIYLTRADVRAYFGAAPPASPA
jgi:hypothetical protein